MLDHVSLHVQDLPRVLAFYRAALAPIGYTVAMEYPSAAGLGEAGKLDLWITVTDKPLRPMHIAFRSTRQRVDAFHAAALAAGGSDNGAPGVRTYHPHYYAAFVIDPEGNNVEVVCHDPPSAPKPPPARAAPVRRPAKKVRKAPRKPARKAAKTKKRR